jgi:hypothetical protein
MVVSAARPESNETTTDTKETTMTNHPSSRIRKRPARTETLTFPFDPTLMVEANRLYAAHDSAEADAVAAEKAGTAEATGLRAKADGAEAELRDFIATMPKVVFHLRSIGPNAVEKLMARPEHRPTPAQVAEHTKDGGKGEPAFNPDTFEPALIAACTATLEQPDTDAITDITADEIIDLFDAEGWGDLDKRSVFATCLTLANAGSLLPQDLVERLGKG